jgi:hypothetical protein
MKLVKCATCPKRFPSVVRFKRNSLRHNRCQECQKKRRQEYRARPEVKLRELERRRRDYSTPARKLSNWRYRHSEKGRASGRLRARKRYHRLKEERELILRQTKHCLNCKGAFRDTTLDGSKVYCNQKCRDKAKQRRRYQRDPNLKMRIYEVNKKYHDSNLTQRYRNRTRRGVERLCNSYVRKLFRRYDREIKFVPPALIEAKKMQIKILRQCNQTHQTRNPLLT